MDVPYTWHDAVTRALIFLSWDEELPSEERPPRSIWLDGDALSEWFDAVKKRREEQYGSSSGSGPGPIEDPVQNDAAKQLIHGG